ncbi:MAG: hypothetical protein ACHQF2_01255, partial [Flavobacteriales bacterium]
LVHVSLNAPFAEAKLYVEEKKLSGIWLHQNNWNDILPTLFNVHKTPLIYCIDRNFTIVAKNITGADLAHFVKNILGNSRE